MGWGLTSDSVSLIVSNGSPDLFFLHPETLEVQRTLWVQTGGVPIYGLNELEWVRGTILANLWIPERSVVAQICPTTGEVLGWLDLGSLRSRVGEEGTGVLNGIAYNPKTETLLVTGKRWPFVFELQIEWEEIL
jgi:glutaminyl-peptide cyclotransferase